MFVALGGASIPVYFLAAHGSVLRDMYYAYGFSSVAAITAGLAWHHPQRRFPWIAFALGQLLFVAGDIAFDLYSGRTIYHFLSVADVLYLSAYPILAIGLAFLTTPRHERDRIVAAIDGSVIAIAAGVLAWVFILAPYAHDRSIPLGERIVADAYPALDLLLLGVLVRTFIVLRSRNGSFLLLSASVTLLLVADSAYGLGTLHGTYHDGSITDLGWIASYLLWGAAALHPSMGSIEPIATPHQTLSRRAPLVALSIAAIAAPTFLLIQALRHAPVDTAVIASASVVLVLLVISRIDILTIAIGRAYARVHLAQGRQRQLTHAAVAFVTAESPNEIAQAAVDAAVMLADAPRATATLSLMSVDDSNIVASASAAKGAADSAQRDDRRSQGKRSSSTRWSQLALPITVATQERGLLTVEASAELRDDSRATLHLLCSQAALALQSAEAAEQRNRARSERRFTSLIEHSSDVVTLVDASDVISYVSPSVSTVLGRIPTDLIGKRLETTISPDDVATVKAALAKVISGELGQVVEYECLMAHADGSWRTMDVSAVNLMSDPDVRSIVLHQRDVSDRRMLERKLEHQALHDALTDLPNRALFIDRVDHALSLASRSLDAIGVLFIDLDDFKGVNDNLGHEAGDALLVEVARGLSVSMRPGDTVARLGGDEFGVLIETGELPRTALAVADRIERVLEVPITIGHDALSVQASIGLAIGRPGHDRAEDLLRNADLAMYVAKYNGKARVEQFQPEMRADALRKFEIASELRHAIEGELTVFYQPIVDLRSPSARGAEALVRWRHPRRGLLSPAEFVPIAESTGLIVTLGRFVLTEACRQLADWRAQGIVGPDFYVSVNVSARQLSDPSLVGDVIRALHETGLPPESLVLEVTESDVMKDPATALSRLEELRLAGIRLALDDFGTGYSSLGHLQSIPVAVVKIDKSFVDRITEDESGEAMVRGIIELSHSLRLVAVAEGVEDMNQFQRLRTLGCDSVQGFLFARPMPAEGIPAALTHIAASTTEPVSDLVTARSD